MYRISKSKYTAFVTCPKQFWLHCHKPELFVPDASLEARFEQGNEAGVFAHGLFGGLVDTFKRLPNGKPDIATMVAKTKDLVVADCPAIAEAAFSSDDVYAAVDILKNNFDGTWDLYEVKSSTGRKLIYLHDVAFQRYVLSQCGIKVRACHLAYVNNKYIRKGTVNPHELFVIEDVTGLVVQDEFSRDIGIRVKEAQGVYAGTEPKNDICANCFSNYKCAFWEYCSAHLPSNSIFSFRGDSGFSKKKKFEYYKKGIVSFEDVRKSGIKLGDIRQRHLDSVLGNKPMYVDKAAVQGFLSTIKFPAYFFDFETYSAVIPIYDGQRPYQQIPCQYSLHILKDKNADTMEHREFLSDESKNDLRTLAERIVADIPRNGGSIIVYTDFESTRLKEMADEFPDLKEHLHDIIFRIVDLYDVFRGGMMYCKEMGGSFSVKSVLPALCPNNPDLDYSLLDDIHNGTEAMTAFLALKKMEATERNRIRQSLLAYCKLDTLAMAEIYKELCLQTA
ncbi:MAG: DUF2779 domain-containing protein [Firmicutes bacterium]|nr:DUF2779 domain-containing protein [Bacillota bacterium]